MEVRERDTATQERQTKTQGNSRQAATWTASTPLHGLIQRMRLTRASLGGQATWKAENK